MTQHTPGPWVVGTETRGEEICTIHGCSNQPSEDRLGQTWVYVHFPRFVNGEWFNPTPENKWADATLIAAAPELLAALQDMLDMREMHLNSRVHPKGEIEVVQSARAAIAKATGDANPSQEQAS
jgi:hypothetical protein